MQGLKHNFLGSTAICFGLGWMAGWFLESVRALLQFRRGRRV
jgi:capsule polysaccharide export protein KpsC/LpsZ